ncbi:hypothetical protein PG990_008933 [Apiospora arundinis]
MSDDEAQNKTPQTLPQGAGHRPIFTPTTSTADSDGADTYPPTTVGGETWDGHCFAAVPWPGDVFLITEKESGRPITRESGGQVALGNMKGTLTVPAESQWLCVGDNNHIGFQNPKTGCYLGHNDKDRMNALAPQFKDWEYMIARPHPKGGYQLLSQHNLEKLKLYVVDEDGRSLVRRMHGTTLFEFRKL